MSSMPECGNCGVYLYHGPCLCEPCAADFRAENEIALAVIRNHGIGVNSETLDDAVRQLLQITVTSRDNSKMLLAENERLREERYELAAALDEQGHSEACTPTKCNCIKSRAKAILDAHDRRSGKPERVCPTCKGTQRVPAQPTIYITDDAEEIARAFEMAGTIDCSDCAGGKKE